ncbi:Protein export cytoplasm protein SecA ATPase RNA helicase (TC 3.A.5.1.1) [Vibrio chagasii]|uniref:SEC-C metal-binding domain-containing protein n=1 Tax=Vibrio sp. 99K-1 TaxID=2607603 RepID=UPI0014937B36|nr:YecA family protein [Vibrio sp. 99K-1]CAH6799303.1 Protein export cytoplasm protein SecA ATPase RNA helicase (TC 3.A.5.1.1) [Vibrio chagasii]NOI85894.1 YecA family protein [Vibrio sp. 99K-1]CAH6886526.1 Protein export cytoplasm protein SecA ATPase RNA helicase (TC 3.A.5.1.1) [Vibrio chagasii]CAH6962832.1 Protein export cytoplasm protein SecA ATPase RNA helicase (TC 3.A.5.1.1) [Vibrio chagasii]CAH6989844.1 Protein export cytoplasm protein SecA ATPase RNA helicase (TC 3.A.5.1.1) [Vibrio chaga
MTYQLLSLPESMTDITPQFLEGAILASNLATKPLEPEAWLAIIAPEAGEALVAIVTEQINRQHNLIQRSEYLLTDVFSEGDFTEQFADFAEGFMMVWPTVEEQWQTVSVADGTLRMLQALLTTLMLAIDEEQTQQQMVAAGLENPPALADLVGQVDLMISEVALAADEAMLGNKSQSVNPFKDIGRNDACPCESGKKFKQCCGKNS